MGEHVLVVTPTFNAGLFIRDTIRSVQEQTHDLWTLVAVDDHSTDNTCQIIEDIARHDARVHLVRLDANSGRPAVPRNRAVAFALCARIPFDYIAFLDDDDMWLPHKLERQLAVFLAHPGMGLVYGRMYVKLRGTFKSRTRRAHVRSAAGLLFSSSIPTSSVVLRRRYVEKHFPLFDEDPKLKSVEDCELWIRLASHRVRIRSCDVDLFIYRVRDNSITVRTVRGQLRRDYYLFRKIAATNAHLPRALVYFAMVLRLCKAPVDKLRFSLSRRILGRVRNG